MHPGEYAFASAAADNIKKWRLPKAELTMTAIQNQRTIVNSLAVNEDGLMASGGDNGSLWCAIGLLAPQEYLEKFSLEFTSRTSTSRLHSIPEP